MARAVLFLVVVTIGLTVACTVGVEVVGILEGRVTIGPIWAVEREGEERDVPPEVYAARKVMVYDRSGKRLVKQVDIGEDGRYRVELKVGVYVVDINRIGVDHSGDVPREVRISPGETVVLDIDIDTGIR